MAALSARKSNPVLRLFYERLPVSAKRPVIAITAVMAILNAKLRQAHALNNVVDDGAGGESV